MLAMRLALALVVCGSPLAAATPSDYGAPSFTTAGVVNAATGQPVLAPHSICTLYGANLYLDGTVIATAGSAAPQTLAGVTVLVGPLSGGLFYVSSNQINLLIPDSIAPGTTSIRVVRDGISSPAVPVTVQQFAPGLFAATHADGSAVADADGSPAVAGEVVILYATGLGPTQPNPPDRAASTAAAPLAEIADFQVLLDGIALDSSRILYAGAAPFNAGLYQVNVRLPDNLSTTNPEIRLNLAGAMSPPGWNLITSPGP